MSKAKSIVEELIDRFAYMPEPRYSAKVGEAILRLSDVDREELKKLTSEELSDARDDFAGMVGEWGEWRWKLIRDRLRS